MALSSVVVGVDVHLCQTTAMALVNGQTKALTLAARVALTPEELPLAVLEMLRAQVVTDPQLIQECSGRRPDDGVHPAGPVAVERPVVFSRPNAPFTGAEFCRANRLAQIAETAQACSAT